MAAAAIPKPLVSDLVAQTVQQVPSSHHIRRVGDRPADADLENVDNESGAAGIPLVVVDLNKLNPNSPEVVEAIGRACESDHGFYMVTNHGVPASPAEVVEGMLRVDGELFRFHLPESESESERLKCYSDDPNKAAEVRALHCYLLESFVVDQWPSNPPSSFRAACNVSGENIRRAIQRWVHKLGCSSPSYCLPITVNDSSLHGSEAESRPFSPLFILQKNDVVEDVSKFDLATIAGTLSLLVPMAINIDELTTNWGAMWKVLYGIFMIMSLMSALIGLFTASFRAGSRARNLSSHCARMSLVVSTIVFMLLIASKLGRVGCVTGVTLVLVMLVLTVLWIRSGEPTDRGLLLMRFDGHRARYIKEALDLDKHYIFADTIYIFHKQVLVELCEEDTRRTIVGRTMSSHILLLLQKGLGYKG